MPTLPQLDIEGPLSPSLPPAQENQLGGLSRLAHGVSNKLLENAKADADKADLVAQNLEYSQLKAEFNTALSGHYYKMAAEDEFNPEAFAGFGLDTIQRFTNKTTSEAVLTKLDEHMRSRVGEYTNQLAGLRITKQRTDQVDAVQVATGDLHQAINTAQNTDSLVLTLEEGLADLKEQLQLAVDNHAISEPEMEETILKVETAGEQKMLSLGAQLFVRELGTAQAMKEAAMMRKSDDPEEVRFGTAVQETAEQIQRAEANAFKLNYKQELDNGLTTAIQQAQTLGEPTGILTDHFAGLVQRAMDDGLLTEKQANVLATEFKENAEIGEFVHRAQDLFATDRRQFNLLYEELQDQSAFPSLTDRQRDIIISKLTFEYRKAIPKGAEDGPDPRSYLAALSEVLSGYTGQPGRSVKNLIPGIPQGARKPIESGYNDARGWVREGGTLQGILSLSKMQGLHPEYGHGLREDQQVDLDRVPSFQAPQDLPEAERVDWITTGMDNAYARGKAAQVFVETHSGTDVPINLQASDGKLLPPSDQLYFTKAEASEVTDQIFTFNQTHYGVAVLQAMKDRDMDDAFYEALRTAGIKNRTVNIMSVASELVASGDVGFAGVLLDGAKALKNNPDLYASQRLALNNVLKEDANIQRYLHQFVPQGADVLGKIYDSLHAAAVGEGSRLYGGIGASAYIQEDNVLAAIKQLFGPQVDLPNGSVVSPPYEGYDVDEAARTFAGLDATVMTELVIEKYPDMGVAEVWQTARTWAQHIETGQLVLTTPGHYEVYPFRETAEAVEKASLVPLPFILDYDRVDELVNFRRRNFDESLERDYYKAKGFGDKTTEYNYERDKDLPILNPFYRDYDPNGPGPIGHAKQNLESFKKTFPDPSAAETQELYRMAAESAVDDWNVKGLLNITPAEEEKLKMRIMKELKK